MMHWIETAMWGLCRVLALALQLAGFAGVLGGVLIGIWALAGRIAEL